MTKKIHLFSYYMTVKGKYTDCIKFHTHLTQTDLTPYAFVQDIDTSVVNVKPNIDDNNIEQAIKQAMAVIAYDTDPNTGPIPEISDIQDSIFCIAAMFPKLEIELSCIDKDNPAGTHNHAYHAGTHVSSQAKIIIEDTETLMTQIKQDMSILPQEPV